MKWVILFFPILFAQCYSSKQPVSSRNKLVWSDEFNYTGLPDSTKWNYDAGDGCPNVCGWGNNELQYYTVADTNNAKVHNGSLHITARKQENAGYKYTSARLVTKHKADWLYGRIEIKAKLPKGRGIWPAIWMLSTDWAYGGWPESGELDIMENVGYIPDTIYSSVHTKSFNHGIGTQKTNGIYIGNAATNFHVYAIEWDANKVRFFTDEKEVLSFANSGKDFKEWPFDKKFHLLLNVAVGGNWGGKFGVDDTIFPQAMEVDYVRVYQ